MLADRAFLRRLRPFVNKAAVPAAPFDLFLLFLENTAVFDIIQKRFVAFLMLFFDLADTFELTGNIIESFLTGFLCHFRIHIGPFIALACRRGFKVGNGISDTAEIFQM